MFNPPVPGESPRGVRRVLVSLVAICGLAIWSSAGLAVTLPWVSTTTSTAASVTGATGVSTLADGSSIVSGTVQGVGVDLGGGSLVTSAEGGVSVSAFTQKFSASGAFVWRVVSTAALNVANPSDAGATSVSTLADGSSIVTGYFTGVNVNLGDGVLRTSSNAGGNQSAFTMKISSAGAVQWVATSTGTANKSTVTPSSVSTLADGSSVVTGTFQSENKTCPCGIDFGTGTFYSSAELGKLNSWSAFTMKIGPTGVVQWVLISQDVNRGVTGGTGVSTLANGSSIVTGNFQGGTVNLGNGALSSAQAGNSQSVFTELINTSGAVQWVRISSGVAASTTGGTAVSALSDGSSIVTGNFTGTDVNFGAGARASAQGGLSQSAFTMKLDALGTPQWVRASAGANASTSGGTGVSTRADGSSFVTGNFLGAAVDLGDGTLRGSALFGVSQSAFTQKLSSTGVVQWVVTSGGTSASTTGGTGISTLANGTSVVTGAFQGGNVDLGDGVLRNSAQTGVSQSAFTLAIPDPPVTPPVPPVPPTPPVPPVTPNPGATVPPATSPTTRTAGDTTTPRRTALPGRTKCTAKGCVTTGTVPAGVKRITETATAKGKTVRGACAIKGGRTYTCTVRLAKGTWAITISGFTPGNVLTAQAVKTQRIR